MARRRALFLILCCSLALAGRAQSSIDSIQALIRAHDYDHALALTKDALRTSPRDFRLWTLQGIALSLSGRPADASKSFQTALSYSPNYPPALRGEVQILYAAGDKQAIPLLERILKIDASDQTAHEMLANLEQRQGNCQAADEQFLLSANATKTHPDSLRAWAKCLMETHQPEKAIPVFHDLVSLFPQSSWPQYDLAVAQLEAKQSDAALRTLEPLLAKNANDPDLLSLASDAYEAAGDTPKAVSLLRQAIVLDPTNSSYYVTFASLCLSHESFQVGVDMLNVGLRHVSGDPSLFISRGLLYAQLAQFDEAEADFRTAEHLDSTQSVSAFAIDIAELQRNHTGTALSDIRAQLKLHPSSPMLNYLLAKMLWSEGSTDPQVSAEAMRYAQLAVRLKPDMVESRNLLADLYIASVQYKLAIEQSRIAMHDDPSDQTAIYHLIVALRHTPGDEVHNEIPLLVKHLAQLQQSSLQQETDRKRFSLVEQKAAPPQ
jgi:tetratricopeptide (TPR) repeat protein